MNECKKTKNLILENNISLINKHLSTCKACKTFYDTFTIINKLKKNKCSAPNHLSFETIYSKEKKNKYFLSYKFMPLTIAACLLLALFIPKLTFNSKPTLKKNNNTITMSDNIAIELYDINNEISYIESEIAYADILIDNDFEEINENINILIT